MSDEDLYHQATMELEGAERDEALWSKSMALNAGDEQRAKYTYISLRVEKLKNSPFESSTDQDERQNELQPETLVATGTALGGLVAFIGAVFNLLWKFLKFSVAIIILIFIAAFLGATFDDYQDTASQIEENNATLSNIESEITSLTNGTSQPASGSTSTPSSAPTPSQNSDSEPSALSAVNSNQTSSQELGAPELVGKTYIWSAMSPDGDESNWEITLLENNQVAIYRYAVSDRGNGTTFNPALQHRSWAIEEGKFVMQFAIGGTAAQEYGREMVYRDLVYSIEPNSLVLESMYLHDGNSVLRNDSLTGRTPYTIAPFTGQSRFREYYVQDQAMLRRPRSIDVHELRVKWDLEYYEDEIVSQYPAPYNSIND